MSRSISPSYLYPKPVEPTFCPRCRQLFTPERVAITLGSARDGTEFPTTVCSYCKDEIRDEQTFYGFVPFPTWPLQYDRILVAPYREDGQDWLVFEGRRWLMEAWERDEWTVNVYTVLGVKADDGTSHAWNETPKYGESLVLGPTEMWTGGLVGDPAWNAWFKEEQELVDAGIRRPQEERIASLYAWREKFNAGAVEA